MFPFVRATIEDAFRRAGLPGVDAVDGIETHDCFTSTEYMAIDHFGITPPGESWRAIEAGDIEIGGRIPVNPSGGLIGLGHPVGATGVRMLLDGFKQVTGTGRRLPGRGCRELRHAERGRQRDDDVSFVVGRGGLRRARGRACETHRRSPWRRDEERMRKYTDYNPQDPPTARPGWTASTTPTCTVPTRR